VTRCGLRPFPVLTNLKMPSSLRVQKSRLTRNGNYFPRSRSCCCCRPCSSLFVTSPPVLAWYLLVDCCFLSLDGKTPTKSTGIFALLIASTPSIFRSTTTAAPNDSSPGVASTAEKHVKFRDVDNDGAVKVTEQFIKEYPALGAGKDTGTKEDAGLLTPPKYVFCLLALILLHDYRPFPLTLFCFTGRIRRRGEVPKRRLH
jgi:hypothetical protein